MNARFTRTLFILGLLMLVFACSNMDNDTLATIDGKSIPLNDFTSKFDLFMEFLKKSELLKGQYIVLREQSSWITKTMHL